MRSSVSLKISLKFPLLHVLENNTHNLFCLHLFLHNKQNTLFMLFYGFTPCSNSILFFATNITSFASINSFIRTYCSFLNPRIVPVILLFTLFATQSISVIEINGIIIRSFRVPLFARNLSDFTFPNLTILLLVFVYTLYYYYYSYFDFLRRS